MWAYNFTTSKITENLIICVEYIIQQVVEEQSIDHHR